MQLLFQIEFTKRSAEEVVPQFVKEFRSDKEVDEFAGHLVAGVEKLQQVIDDRIKDCSEHWSLGRISRVDRSILRIAIFEILCCPDIPPKVSINEAIELSKKFSTEKSSAFINGILDKVAHAAASDQSTHVVTGGEKDS